MWTAPKSVCSFIVATAACLTVSSMASASGQPVTGPTAQERTSTPGFLPFREQANRIAALTGCDRIPPHMGGFRPAKDGENPFFRCIIGEEGTAKLWVQSSDRAETGVSYVRLSWNEWTSRGTPDRREGELILYGGLEALGLQAIRNEVATAFYAPAPGTMRSLPPVEIQYGSFRLVIRVDEGTGLIARTVRIVRNG